MNLSAKKTYRPEIDGLRAIAIILILLFHAGFDWISGGYIGVDVFFVISGYLITRNIIWQMNHGLFSFSGFYINRIRRLIPALFFTLVLTLILGFYIFSPADLERLGQSTIAATVSLSNFFFWAEADYFNPSSEIKPLLHTWSLAVEEQFYLIWPAILLFLFKANNRVLLKLFFIVSAVVSLIACQFYIDNHPEAVFFLLPFRFFEFSIGALCAFYSHPFPKKRSVNNSLFTLGLLMIILPAIFYTKDTVFPGLYALIPCLGTAVLILLGQHSNLHTILSNKIMIKIGLISYSTYLIHWPIFVYYRYWKFDQINLIEIFTLLLLSLVIGYLMWKFIENPFRYSSRKNKLQEKAYKPSRLFLLTMALVAISLFYSSHYIWKQKGIPSRMPAEFLLSQDEINKNRSRFRRDFSSGIKQFLKGGEQSKNVVMMGNSHAVDLLYALRENNSNINFTLLSTSARCYNFGSPVKEKFKKYCDSKLKSNLKKENFKNIDAIYLHDNWPRFNEKDLRNRLTEIRNVSDAPIYVFGPKMTYDKTIPQIVASHMRMASINQYSVKYRVGHRPKTNDSIRSLIENIDINDIYFVDILRAQCGDTIKYCHIVSEINQKFLYFDAGHFTLQGAFEAGQNLKIKYPHLF
ncbi:MAG: acyltransferase family protein [Marinicellaceae bacterium]